MASKQDSTGGTTPPKGEAAQAMAGVGGVRSSDEAAPDLWFGQNTEERRDATCSAARKRNEELVTARKGYKRRECSGIAIPRWCRGSARDARNSESRMRENRLSGLMRGGKQTVIGPRASQSVASCLLYTEFPMHLVVPEVFRFFPVFFGFAG
jgi:hypothetical protein